MYHPAWRPISAYALLSATAMNGAFVVGATALLLGHFAEAAAIAGALGVYAVGMAWQLIAIELAARRVARDRCESIHSLSWKLIGAGLLTHYIYLIRVATAMRAREIEWRGIRYRLGGPRKIHLLHYRPYQPKLTAPDAHVSL
jgi:hypothetical protein